MRYLKSLSLTIVGIVAYNLGSFLDHGHIQRVVAAGMPLYMNTPPEMTMVFSCFVVMFGLFWLFAEWCEHIGIPLVGDGVSGLIAYIQYDVQHGKTTPPH